MPILNLENPTFISIDGAGRPNSGGTVEVYEAGGTFTTLATIYADQVQTSELTNPVTLDSAGTKEIWFDVKVDIREKTSAGVVIRDTLNLDPNASQASVQGFNLAQNGSFEIDSTSDGQPDNWTISPYAGSAIAITEDVVRHGTKALEFNTAGASSGGGTATSAKFPVTEGGDLSVSWSFYANHASTLNTFQIKWYDEDDVLQSTSTLTMPASGSVPTSWTEYTESVTADAAATQGEIVLTGISSGGSNLSSKAYFDGISVIDVSNIATVTGSQTLTNKTLTSPVINTSVTGTAPIEQIDQSSNTVTTSGTTVDVTGIDSWAKKITVTLIGVSTDGTSDYILQLGDAGGFEATGYDSAGGAFSTSVQTSASSTAGFLLCDNTSGATSQVIGSITLVLHDTSNTWAGSGVFYTRTAIMHPVGGYKSLSGTLTQVRLTSAGGDTFDLGSMRVTWEG